MAHNEQRAAPGSFHRMPLVYLGIRVSGMLGIALICVLMPAVGENRFLVAGLLSFAAAPLAIWFNRRFRVVENGWAEPLLDLLLVVTLIHLVPQVWFPALCVGLMVSLAPSVGLTPLSYRVYASFAVVLIVGMVLAAVVHGVQNWVLPTLTVAAVYPSVIFYSHWQARRAEELRERAQRLSGLNQIAGSVAHDFNNMLMAISGHAELAQLDLPESHPAAAAVREVISGANRASLLCSQLLAFSGRKVQSNQVLDWRAELEVIVGLMEPVVPKGVRLALQAPADVCLVRGDRAELQQVVMNVILNAGESISQVPSRIDLRLYLDADADAPWVVLEVQDQGAGIAAENLERIFDPFFTSKERGHGLGLASAQRIMKAHGGSIEVQSEPGSGTRVSLRIPQALSAEVALAGGVSGTTRGAGLVLVVDDDPQVREVAQGYLQRMGHEVLLAADADEAIGLFTRQRERVAAVLLDLKMPGKDGWQCLAELRALRPDVAVVICSGFDPVGLQLSKVDPPVTYLGKPFRLRDLRAALDEALNQDKPVAEEAAL